MKSIIFALAMICCTASLALAELKVVATLPWIGSVVKEIGKDKLVVTTLVKPSQDPHYVEAKPSMILAGRTADIIMYNGLDLEAGYLPLILESSKNGRIMPGKPGNFDCSQTVLVIEKNPHAERSMGDVHPLGNPHYHYSAANVLRVAEQMAITLAQLDPANGAFYQANLKAFRTKMTEKQRQWQGIRLAGKQYLAYHRLFEYLASEYGFRISGYLEPKPGIPPSAAHTEKLIAQAKQSKPAGILVTASHGARDAEALATRTGIKVITLPQDVGAMAGTGDWFSFMDRVIGALR